AGGSLLLLIDQGLFTFEARAAQEIAAQALQESFFEALRTEQRTGYIAKSIPQEHERHLYHTFLVQSNTHTGQDLLGRFELFLENYLLHLSDTIPLDRFETLKQSAIVSLKTRYKNLAIKSTLLDRLAFEEGGDFGFVEKRIEALSALSYEVFVQACHNFFGRLNSKRIALYVEGALQHPFHYTPLEPSEISQVVSYEPRKQL
ncbi:MAG: hypothetical protein RL235_751, partial [Chlamydiota bacterium]